MWKCVLLFSCAAAAFSQQVTTTYGSDINGRRAVDSVYSSSTSGKVTTRTELTQSVNGRMVPLESTEERVISDDANGRVVERILRRFDANGNPTLPEKHQIQERKNADGSVSSVTTIYRGDINGSYQLGERVITESSKNANTVNSNVVVERPTVNGSMEVVEKQVRVVNEQKDATKSDVTTYRRTQDGRFTEALRVVTDATVSNGNREESVAQYEPADTGRLRLAAQQVTRARKNPDGSETREVDIFRDVPGRAESSATPRLRERQIIEQKKVGDQLVETTLVQRPTISDPNRLGPPSKIGERVCNGPNCR
jgi:hypothetical protein